MSYDDALTHALRAALDAGADDVEISYGGSELYFARFASSRFTQVGTARTDVVRVRALVGRRLGTELCGSLDPARLAATARGAVDAARQAPELEVPLAFADEATADPAPPTAMVHEAIAPAHAPSTLGRAFELARARDCHCAGALKVETFRSAVRTAAGARRDGEHGRTELGLIALANGDDSSGFAGHAADSAAAIDIDALAQTAIDKAARGRRARRLDAGEIDVVLAPEAVAELLEWMETASFGGQSVLDGQSLLAGRAGESVCDPRITIEERADELVAFDAEGSSRQRVALIDAGRAGQSLTDRLTALRLDDGRATTGHASAIDAGAFGGPTAMHLHMAPGELSEAELIGAVDRGLYVTRLHYVNGMLDPRRAMTTGMTRDGTFEIVGGKLAGGVRNLRFTDSVLDAWGARLGGIGSTTRAVPTWWGHGGLLTVPAVLVRGFRFTGQSR